MRCMIFAVIISPTVPELIYCDSYARRYIVREEQSICARLRLRGYCPVDYPDSYLETLAVYRKIATKCLNLILF